MKWILVLVMAIGLTPFAYAVPTIIEDSADRFEITFINDDMVNDFAPVGATGGRTLDIFSGGESAAIAISILFEDPIGNNETNLFIFEFISGDIFFPGPNNAGDVLVYSTANGFAGADAFFGNGVLQGFTSTELTVIVGPSRDDPFFARLVLTKEVPEPSMLALIGLVLAWLGFAHIRRARLARNRA